MIEKQQIGESFNTLIYDTAAPIDPTVMEYQYTVASYITTAYTLYGYHQRYASSICDDDNLIFHWHQLCYILSVVKVHKLNI